MTAPRFLTLYTQLELSFSSLLTLGFLREFLMYPSRIALQYFSDPRASADRHLSLIYDVSKCKLAASSPRAPPAPRATRARHRTHKPRVRATRKP